MTGQQVARAHGLALAMILGLFAITPVSADDKPGKTLAALERKLHGVWLGSGPCDGRIIFKADGAYERELHGPGGNNSSGTWNVRWDSLPPTLVLSCKTSDDRAYVGKTLEVKLVQLDDAELVFKYREQKPAQYTRDKKAPDPEAGGKGEGVTKDGLVGKWQSVEITLMGGQSDLDLKSDGKFVYDHLDVGLGWRTNLVGTWELKGNRLVLTAQQRRHDGRDVEVGDKKTEEMSATRRGEAWILSSVQGLQLRKAPKSE